MNPPYIEFIIHACYAYQVLFVLLYLMERDLEDDHLIDDQEEETQ